MEWTKPAFSGNTLFHISTINNGIWMTFLQPLQGSNKTFVTFFKSKLTPIGSSPSSSTCGTMPKRRSCAFSLVRWIFLMKIIICSRSSVCGAPKAVRVLGQDCPHLRRLHERGGGSSSATRAVLGARRRLILLQLLWQTIQNARFA